ncbi:F0F1 ATP synthase subunit A [Candidatus Dependentiae bacterium]|nr:F0F1 ATP synthase subunit A [Candidatus Dependentiae bacterium]
MEGGLDQAWHWYPLAPLGVTHPLAAVHADTLINTWVALAALIVLVFLARWALTKKNSVGYHLIKAIIKNYMQLIVESNGTFVYRYYALIGSLFSFILLCNWIALLPFVEEPTKDINTTLALGIVVFFYIQKEIIKVHGISHFLKEYFAPFNLVFPLNILAGIALFPLKLLGELASVISLSFRLFGNIFGGTIILHIAHQAFSKSLLFQLIGLLSGLHLLLSGFFIIFEGFLQAFVFSILAITNISLAVSIEQQQESV